MALPDRLVLVDGNALLYRAYHAIPARFSTAAGLPTNAVYGFATMFKEIFATKTRDEWIELQAKKRKKESDLKVVSKNIR